MNNEIWKDIEGYEGLYQVSDKGRVKSLKRGNDKIMSLRRDKDGYLLVNLWNNHERKTFKVHRLVCQAYITNSHNLPQVNHKDENKDNNCVENLEWCDSKYNNNYGTHNQRSADKQSKPVLQYTLDGKLVDKWKSGHDVERNLGYNQCNISSCCNEKRKSAYGFVWRYKQII